MRNSAFLAKIGTFFAVLGVFASFSGVLNAKTAVFTIENDSPFGDDSDYTNGARLEYRDDGWSVFAEQLMYSPESIRNDVYVVGTHPYAGYFGVGGSYTAFQPLGHRFMLTHWAELSTGLVGPSAGAEETQRTIHRWIGAHDPKGWDFQLHDEWEIQSAYLIGVEWLALGSRDGWNLRTDVEAGGYLGTIQIAGAANADVKLGWSWRDDSRKEIEIHGCDVLRESYLYLLAGLEGRWWGWNVFLDGNRDGDSFSVDKEPWTGALKLGGGVEVGHLEVDMLYLFKTREYETQRHTPNYASLSVGYRF